MNKREIARQFSIDTVIYDPDLSSKAAKAQTATLEKPSFILFEPNCNLSSFTLFIRLPPVVLFRQAVQDLQASLPYRLREKDFLP